MLEQEVASIAGFIIKASDDIRPYYCEVPENFLVPAVYFPMPEFVSSPDTLSTYSTKYSLFVKFFHVSDEKACAAAYPAYTAVNSSRGRIPLVDISGNPAGRFIKITGSAVSRVDDGAYQLQLEWRSRSPFNEEEYDLVRNFYLNGGRI
ncbi:MAG: hypothetical protein ACI4I9_04650 [Porcipelethomonas sp.]